MCKTYSQRPSDVIGLTDPFVALDFDIAMSTVHRLEEQAREEAASQPSIH